MNIDLTYRNSRRRLLAVAPLLIAILGVASLPAAATPVADDLASDAEKGKEETLKLEDYEVTGQKPKPFSDLNVDIPRGINDVQPYYIFDSKAIELSGATNVEDFLAKNVPMNVLRSTNSSNTTSYGSNSDSNLRGLGTDRTLILVNGRRLPSTVVLTSVYQPDINGISPNSIERIEVLPTSASGIYGGNALGGVINIVLKRNYNGGEIRTNYANTWDTDAARRSVSFNWGQSLEDGRTQISVSAQYSDGTALRVQDRADIIQRNYATILRNYPDFLYTQANPFAGATTNITNSVAGNLVLKDGTALGSRITHVPTGLAPTASAAQVNTALLQNAGSYNLDLPSVYWLQSGLGNYFGFTPTSRSYSASVTRKFLPNLEAFVDYSFSRNRGVELYSSYFNSARTVAATAPNNPFTTAVLVKAPAERLRPRIGIFDKDIVTAGLKVNLPHDWIALLDYTWVQENALHSYEAVDDAAVNAAFASGQINPFADTQLYPISLDPFATAARLGNGSTQNSVSARASGPLPKLPWGQPTLTVGLENRLTGTTDGFNESYRIATGVRGNPTTYFGFKQIAASAYAEINTPLIEQGRLPWAYALELQLAGRTDRYNVGVGTSSASTNAITGAVTYNAPTLAGSPYRRYVRYDSTSPTVGLKFQPVPSITLRGSYAQAFQPPTAAQLGRNAEPSTTPTVIIDPNTGTSYGVQTIGGGNPELKPQSSKSRNIGVIWEPRSGALRGLRLDAEYYEIQQADAIASLGAQVIINLYPDRVTRDTGTGLITLVDTSSFNLYGRDLSGWDFSASYRYDAGNLGAFTFRGTESLFLSSTTQFSLTLPAFEGVNYPIDTANGGTLRYQANLNLTWERGQWTAGLSSRLLSAYRTYGAAGGPLSQQSAGGADYSNYVLAQGSRTVPSQDFHDVVVSYAFPKAHGARGGFTDGLTVTAGVKNVFNAEPELDVGPWALGYVSPFADIRLREYWVNIRKAF